MKVSSILRWRALQRSMTKLSSLNLKFDVMLVFSIVFHSLIYSFNELNILLFIVMSFSIWIQFRYHESNYKSGSKEDLDLRVILEVSVLAWYSLGCKAF